MKVTTIKRSKSNTREYYYIKWDATNKKTGKTYRACSNIITNRKKAEAFAVGKENPELFIDYCAGFL